MCCDRSDGYPLHRMPSGHFPFHANGGRRSLTVNGSPTESGRITSRHSSTGEPVRMCMPAVIVPEDGSGPKQSDRRDEEERTIVVGDD